MATQEIDVATHVTVTLADVSAADDTLADAMSLHWDDTEDPAALQDLLHKIMGAFIDYQAANKLPVSG